MRPVSDAAAAGRSPAPAPGHGPESARRIAAELDQLAPADAATRFRLLDEATAAAVFDVLDASEQRRLLEGLRSPRVQRLLEAMEPDDRVRLLDQLPAAVSRPLLADLSAPERKLTDLLLGHPPETAGRIMSPEYLELAPDATVAQALQSIRRDGHGLETLLVLPVRDRELRLAGVVRLTDLVRADPQSRIAEIVDPGYPAAARARTRRPWRG